MLSRLPDVIRWRYAHAGVLRPGGLDTTDFPGTHSGRVLCMSASVFDDSDHSVRNNKSERFRTRPSANMEPYFWRDADRARYAPAYFACFDET